jgi:hypothetical protein
MLLGQIRPNSYDFQVKASLLRSIVWSMYEDKEKRQVRQAMPKIES